MQENENNLQVYELNVSVFLKFFEITDKAVFLFRALHRVLPVDQQFRIAMDLPDDEEHGFGFEEIEKHVDEISKFNLPGIIINFPGRNDGQEFSHGFFKDDVEEFLFATEIVVKGSFADAGFVSDLLHAGAIVAVTFKNLFSGVEDLPFGF